MVWKDFRCGQQEPPAVLGIIKEYHWMANNDCHVKRNSGLSVGGTIFSSYTYLDRCLRITTWTRVRGASVECWRAWERCAPLCCSVCVIKPGRAGGGHQPQQAGLSTETWTGGETRDTLAQLNHNYCCTILQEIGQLSNLFLEEIYNEFLPKYVTTRSAQYFFRCLAFSWIRFFVNKISYISKIKQTVNIMVSRFQGFSYSLWLVFYQALSAKFEVICRIIRQF